MRSLVIVAILAVVSAQEYHRDDNEGSFHFTTLKNQVALGGLQTLGNLGGNLQRVQSVQTIQQVQRPQIIQIQQQPAFVRVQQVQQQAPVQLLRTVQVQRPVVQVQRPVVQVQQAPVQLLRTVQVQQPAVQLVQQPIVQVQQAPVQLLRTVQVQQPQQILVRDASATLASRTNYAAAYNGPQWRILEQVQEVDPAGPYKASFKTENGIQVVEEGALINAGPEGPAVAKQGSYSWTSPEGIPFTVSWIADDNGFRAAGDHLPTPPPIPAEILRSLEENARDGTQFDEQGFPLRK